MSDKSIWDTFKKGYFLYLMSYYKKILNLHLVLILCISREVGGGVFLEHYKILFYWQVYQLFFPIVVPV